MTQTMFFVACGCKIETSQTDDLKVEKIVILCRLHEPLKRNDIKSIYNDVFNYSRSFVKPYEPFGDEDTSRKKLNLIQEDLADSSEKASRGISRPPRTKKEIDEKLNPRIDVKPKPRDRRVSDRGN